MLAAVKRSKRSIVGEDWSWAWKSTHQRRSGAGTSMSSGIEHRPTTIASPWSVRAAVPAKQAVRRDEVVIQEPDQAVAGSVEPGVAGGGEAPVRLPPDGHRHPPRPALDRLSRTVGRAVEHHHDAKAPTQGRIASKLVVEGMEQPEQRVATLVRRDGDGHRSRAMAVR